jgi:RNA polymerase nonessential primary-like sigma factor
MPKSPLQPKKQKKERQEAISPYLRLVSQMRVLNAEEEQVLFQRVAQGDEKAKGLAIEHNLRLVLKVARRYLNRGLSFSDLVAEGNLGLIRAVEKFDPALGFRFSTYACPWIAQNIDRALLNTASIIRIPIHIVRGLNRVKKSRNQLSQILTREASLDEASTWRGEALSDAVISAHRTHVISFTPLDFDQESLEDSLTLIENEVENQVEESELFGKITAAIQALSPLHKDIITGRYGLHNQDAKTLEALGLTHGLTLGSVRQNQFQALKAIRKFLSK